MAIPYNMGVTTELPRRDGEKGATIPGEHEPGMWWWCGSGVDVEQILLGVQHNRHIVALSVLSMYSNTNT